MEVKPQHQAPMYVGFLFVVFLFLKLDGQIDWSWIAVTAPLWLYLLPGLLFFAVGYVVLTVKARRLIKANLNR